MRTRPSPAKKNTGRIINFQAANVRAEIQEILMNIISY